MRYIPKQDLGAEVEVREEYAQGIMTEGNKLYNECLGKFAQLRRKEGITDDRRF